MQAGLSAQRIYQDLICIAYAVFRDGYVPCGASAAFTLVTRQPVPFVRMRLEPGQEAQVDFGAGCVGAGKRQTQATASVSVRPFPFPQRLQ